jgi:hypothetical protein
MLATGSYTSTSSLRLIWEAFLLLWKKAGLFTILADPWNDFKNIWNALEVGMICCVLLAR